MLLGNPKTVFCGNWLKRVFRGIPSVHEMCRMPYDTWAWPSVVGCGCVKKHAASVSQHDLSSSRRKPCPSSNNSSIKWNLIIGMSTAEVSRGISSMALLWPTYLLSQQHEWVEPLFSKKLLVKSFYMRWDLQLTPRCGGCDYSAWVALPFLHNFSGAGQTPLFRLAKLLPISLK